MNFLAMNVCAVCAALGCFKQGWRQILFVVSTKCSHVGGTEVLPAGAGRACARIPALSKDRLSPWHWHCSFPELHGLTQVTVGSFLWLYLAAPGSRARASSPASRVPREQHPQGRLCTPGAARLETALPWLLFCIKAALPEPSKIPGIQQLLDSWGWDETWMSNKEMKTVAVSELLQLGVTAARAAEWNLFEMWVRSSKGVWRSFV